MILDFADVRPTLLNTAVVGTMAILWIAFWKFVLSNWNVPGLSDLLASI